MAGFDPATGKPIEDNGTIAEGVERFPQRAPVQPTAAPIEEKQSWGSWLSSGWDHTGQAYDAGRDIGRNDRSDFSEIAIRDGYKPILDQLGLDETQNPLAFGDRSGVKGEVAMRSSELLRRQGKDWLSSMADRDTQELEIAREIQRRRAADPKFMPGVPSDVAGLHSYFIEAEKKKRAAANQVLERNRGAGVVAGNLAGSMVESLHDPVNILTLPIGGGGKTITQVLVRETLVNGLLEAAQLPFVHANREAVGEHLSIGEAAADVATAGVAGGALEGALHGTGKLIVGTAKATGAIRVRNNPDLASSTAYKIFGALPEHVQKKYGPGVVTKWGKRLADGDALDDVFADLSNEELASVHRTIVGDENLTPEEKAGLAHLDRSTEIAASSPYQADPTSTAAHEQKLEDALNDVIANTPREETRPVPPVGSDAGASAPSSARSPGATSTAARRPLSAPSGPLRVPSWIYEGLKARGIDDHIAKGAAAGSAAEALGGDPRALNPKSGAFGIGQWLGGRKAELMRRYNGHPTPEQQLDFLAWELKGGDSGGRSVLSAKNEVEALNRYIVDFMRPAKGFETDRDLRDGMKALGRGGDALPAPEGEGAGSIEFAEDPEIARLRDDALKLDDAVIGSSSSAGVPPMYGRQYRPDELTVDAARFQFKSGGDDLGVTDRLRGVKEWNPMYAGRVVAWEDAGGRVFPADGHQRVGLAKRLESEGHPPIGIDALVLREADGVSAEDARVYGALKNIAEGTGSMVDAAKVIRGAGDHLLAHLPPKSALVRDARALSSLSDEAFGAVYNDVLPADYAAVIGHLLPDRPEAHAAMVDLLVKTDPANRGQAESIVRQGIAAGMHKSEQVELFGTREVMSSLMLERAKVLERVLANLRKSKLVFKTAAKEADTLEAVGSKIAKSASEKEAQANAQALEIVSRLAFSHGPIAEALNAAARKLAAGAKLGDVADEAARAIRGTDLGDLARTAASDDASRLVPDGAGRGGDAGETGEAIRSQSGEQPSLIDLERATERFSDPDGPAVKQQAESLEHDFIAAVTDGEPGIRDHDYRETLDPAFLDQADAEDIVQHAIDAHAIKLGRELGVDEDSAAAIVDEIAKLLHDTNDVPASVKLAEKALKDGRLKTVDHGEPDLPEPKPLPPSTLVPAGQGRKSADYAGAFMAPEEAAAKVKEWKAEAKRIGKESPPPANHVILSLFDASGNWSKPYREMGYNVIQLDAKHGVDVIGDISHIQIKIDELRAQGYHFAGVIAQPPCTTFAASGARWWEPRHNRAWQNAMRKMFGAEAVKLFETPVEYNQFLVLTAEEFISRSKPDFFVIENPVGRIEKMAGLPKPELTIDPNHFGDPYTKKTNLWGKFNSELPTAHVDPVEGSRVHKLRSRDEKEEGLRSLTPEGFAYAFALANRPGTDGAAARAVEAPAPAKLDPAARRERIKAATAALEGGKPGEFRTIEPFPEEPGYHRFRYVASDGSAVGGNYTIDRGPPPILEGFNVGDTNNPTKLGPREVRKMFAEIKRQHPEIERIHAFRMTGARAATGDGAKEIWIDLAGKGDGVKPEDVDVRVGEPVEPVEQPAAAGDALGEPVLHGGDQIDPAIAERQRQQTELKAAAPLQPLHEQLGTMGLNLFDHGDQPTFRLSEEGDEISGQDLLDELTADETAIKALRDCL